MHVRRLTLCAWLAALTHLPVAAQDAARPTAEDLPTPAREFRAAWVATVANIDWPSKPGLSTKDQQREAIAILDRLVELHMNAVVFQVRPHADALYRSKLEPWSFYLTGKEGKAPKPAYDPLEFWIDEAHERGLELHAWFNPYRVRHPAQKGGPSKDSLRERHPELVVELGKQGYWWMVPTKPEVQDHSAAVIADVVRRYDVDGVHFDDYFYPYASYNDGKDFPDADDYAAYREGGGALSLGDWRRAAVDGFVERVWREVHEIDPRVRFGISPFGIWRPGHPASIQGMDQYDKLYADAKKWLNEGHVDYFTPQLYWPIAQVPQSFPVLLGWWSGENTKGRHLWPGTSIGRARREGGVTEILNQVQVVRGMVPNGPGLCLFSMKVLQDDGFELAKALRDGPWSRPALVPASTWLDDEAPEAPKLRERKRGGERQLKVTARSDDTFLFVIDQRVKGAWRQSIVPAAAEDAVTLHEDADAVAVRAVDRTGNLGAPAWLD